MADTAAPQPLRRKPVQKPADSRYVSLFSDASNKSDITITDGHKGLLPKSTKLYEVGVDNLTLSLNGLSMLSPSATEPIILELLALRTYGGQAAGDAVAQWSTFPQQFRIGNFYANYQLKDTEVYTTFSQILDRLNQIGEKISEFINAGWITGTEYEFRDVVAFTPPHPVHLSFTLHNSGRIAIAGSRTFWSYFCIHIPNPHYRSILYGSNFDPATDQRVICINPASGAFIPTGARFAFGVDPGRGPLGMYVGFTHAWGQIDGNIDPAFEILVSNNPQNAASEAFGTVQFIVSLQGNLYSSLDERVCIEVGTSLPLTHSALIEDNKEGPDYSLGRFMFNSGLRVGFEYGAERHTVHGPSTFELMNSEKRVMYHRLLPQEKVSVLRIQMYIRRRVYDSATNKWKMKSEPLPTVPSDWWHCRLHFRELHETSISQMRSPYQ